MSDPDDGELRKSVEELMDALQWRVLQNDELLALLDERDQTIAQLEATIEFLAAELRRAKVNPRRVRSISRSAASVVMALVGNFGAGAGGAYVAMHAESAKPTPVIEQPGPVGDAVRSILKQCEQIIERSQVHHVSDTDEGRIAESQSIQAEGLQVGVKSGTPNLRASDVAGGSDAATGPTGPTGTNNPIERNGPDGPLGPTGFTGEVGIPGRLSNPGPARPSTVANAGVAEGDAAAHDATVETDETPPTP